MILRAIPFLAAVLLTATPVSAQLDQILKGLGSGGRGLSDVKIGSGLKEALHQQARGRVPPRSREVHE